jgi:(p)ppGpp synthase/HD superfamily hydrolase
MKLKDIIESEKEASDFAEKAHAGQKRMGGEPYVVHPQRVAEIVRKYKKSHVLNDLVSAAFLHDTIEDAGATKEKLEKMFNGLVASLVQELTTDEEKKKLVGKTEYLKQKMTNMSSWALVIKLADRLDNVSDLSNANEKFRTKYKKETEDILNHLEKNRKLSETQKRLIVAIKEKLSELR